MSRTLSTDASSRTYDAVPFELLHRRGERTTLRNLLFIFLALSLLTWLGVAAMLFNQQQAGHISDLSHSLQVRDRNNLYAYGDHLSDVLFDPRMASSLAADIRRFANDKSLPTERLDRLISTIPEVTAIHPASAVTIHRAFQLLPATIVELSIVDPVGLFINGISRFDIEVLNGTNRLRHVQIALTSQSTSSQAIAVLLDCSESMKGEPHSTAKRVSQQFVTEFANPSRIQPWQFSDTATPLTAWTLDTAVLVESIEPLRAHSGTALYLAIQEAIKSLSTRAERRSLVVLTDGEDSYNKISPDSLAEQCRLNQITLYSVALGKSKNGFAKLQTLTKQTGGGFYSAETTRYLASAFRELADTLRTPMYRIVILDEIDSRLPVVLHIEPLRPVPLILEKR